MTDRLALYEQSKFQSTLPVRGATKIAGPYDNILVFQSTLPVRGATKALDAVDLLFDISIHAPRAGSDFANVVTMRCPD